MFCWPVSMGIIKAIKDSGVEREEGGRVVVSEEDIISEEIILRDIAKKLRNKCYRMEWRERPFEQFESCDLAASIFKVRSVPYILFQLVAPCG